MTGGLSSSVDGDEMVAGGRRHCSGNNTHSDNTIQWDHHNITFDFFNKETILGYRVTYRPRF